MASDGEPTVAVKLFIDKEKSRVLFAESDQDFVDVLFSFLTLPLGTIVRLLGKNSQVGCLDELYKSVEDLSIDQFVTKACKAMLLSPCNAAVTYCNQLKVNVDDSNAIYRCERKDCYRFSNVPDVVCVCGDAVQYHGQWPKHESGDGVFVITGSKFIITDDLQVALASTGVMFSLMDKFGIPEKVNIEEKVLQLNSSKIISLLRRALLTKEPLTGLYFDAAIAPNATNLCKVSENLFAKQAGEADPNFSAIKVRLVQAKDDSVLYAEVGQDFVDMVFGLLCIPLGSIMERYSQLLPNGSIDSIYKSVDISVKQECKSLLLSPKLPPFFRCSCNVMHVQEIGPRCVSNCSELCPKYFYPGYRDYIKRRPINFMVTNGLKIVPFSLPKTLQYLCASKFPKEKLVEREITLNKVQVLEFLGAAIGTREALSSMCLSVK